jgi:SAM-dependent methyltransferase
MPASIMEDVARACAREARLNQGGLFLDAAFGTGRFTVPLSRLHPSQIVGVDISPAMLSQAQHKNPVPLNLTIGDVQRLPFRSGSFTGVLTVHLLHLVEQWRLVLDELRRVVMPKTGVLFLGGEQGGRSLLVDFYYQRARAQGVLSQSLGTPGLRQALAYMRRDSHAQVRLLSLPYLKWQRVVSVPETLEALTQRTYSQMWNVPDDVHRELLAETTDYARRTLGDLAASETLRASFSLYAIRWAG